MDANTNYPYYTPIHKATAAYVCRSSGIYFSTHTESFYQYIYTLEYFTIYGEQSDCFVIGNGDMPYTRYYECLCLFLSKAARQEFLGIHDPCNKDGTGEYTDGADIRHYT